jgi:hypothetical protein
MGRLFAAARGEAAADDSNASDVLEQWLAQHRLTEARIRATIERASAGGAVGAAAAGDSASESKARSPLADVIRIFELTPRQWSTLMFAMLPEVDPNLVHAYR